MLTVVGCAADRKEFIKISQAIAMGFVAMGTVGFVVKLSMSPCPSARIGAPYGKNEMVANCCSSHPHQQHPRRCRLSDENEVSERAMVESKTRLERMHINREAAHVQCAACPSSGSCRDGACFATSSRRRWMRKTRPIPTGTRYLYHHGKQYNPWAERGFPAPRESYPANLLCHSYE